MIEKADAPLEPQFSRDEFFSVLVERGLLGLAWADTELVVKGTTGKLAWWLSPGDHLTEDLAPFVGLDDDLMELMDDFRPSLVLSNVGMNVEIADSEKTSIEVFWQDQAELFVVVVHRLGGQPAFEEDMARQLRGRRLAEENIAAMQRQVRQTQNLLDIIAERSPVGIAVQDLEKKYQFVTTRWFEQLGITAETPVVSDHDPFAKGVLNALQGHETSGSPDQHAGGGSDVGNPINTLAWRHRPWMDATGAVAGVVSAIHPVGEIAAERDRLRARVSDLERVNQDLESFAAMLSHDVRAPIAALRNRLVGDNSEELPPHVVSEMDATLARVQQIANGLLEFATASGIPGPASAVDLGAMTRRIAEECTSGSQMRFELIGDWPTVTTAVAPLDLILRNLVQNAVRHHDTGSGWVRLSAHQDDNTLCIEVRDDGPGIPQEYHASVFNPLETVDSTGSGSTGLGLAFVKRAVASLNATLELESDPRRARGTTFRLIWTNGT